MNDLELALTKHDYRLNGEKLVNVTTISGLLDDGKSNGFAGAAVKLTKEGQNYREVWKASGSAGTRVHGYCESFLKGESIEMVSEDAGFVDALEKFILDRDPQVIELEQIVLSSEGYGGRFDILATLDDEIALIDVKTGKPYPVEHSLQLSAYHFADGIAEYDVGGSLIGLRDLPLIAATYCLYVREDGTYSLTRYPGDAEAWRIFLALLDAYRWARTPEMQATVKEARK